MQSWQPPDEAARVLGVRLVQVLARSVEAIVGEGGLEGAVGPDGDIGATARLQGHGLGQVQL